MISLERLSLRDIQSTTTFRLAVILGILFTLGMIAFGGLLYGLTVRELTARSDQILWHEADRLSKISAGRLTDQVVLDMEINQRGLDKVALFAADGKSIAGSIAMPPGLVFGQAIDVEAHEGFGPMRMLKIKAAGGAVILLGRDISEIRYLLRRIFDVISICCLLVIPIVLLIGYFISLRPLRRIQQLQNVAKGVAMAQFGLRMPIAGSGDELDRIARTVNAMVEDVARIVAQVKHATDVVAHDLRTPLTRVRSQLDDLRHDGHLPPRLADTVAELIVDLDVVLDRFSAILRIAELEAGAQRSGFATVAVAPLMLDIFELYQPLAEEAGLRLAVAETDGVCVDADRNLLFEAISNLVDNAIKFGGSTVWISTILEDERVVIQVRDDGPGIPGPEREAVLRRFYRGAADLEKPGSGLGLSVVNAIVHLHRFSFELVNLDPGLAARIVVPAQSASAGLAPGQ